MFEFHFDYRDIFKAPRVAFSIRKIFINFRALTLGFLIYNLFTYLGLIASGIKFPEAFRTFYLFPPLLFTGNCIACGPETAAPGSTGILIQLIGIVLFCVITLMSSAAVAKIAFEQLKGNSFYTAREAWGFVRRNWLAVIASPLVLSLCLLSAVGCVLLIAAIGRIPYVGDVFTAFMVLPLFFLGLIVVLFSYVTTFGLNLSPAVVGCTGGDTFETTFELVSTATTKPMRLILYQLLHIVFGTVIWAVFGLAVVLSLKIVLGLTGLIIGPDFYGISRTAFDTLPTVPCCGSCLSPSIDIGRFILPAAVEAPVTGGVWNGVITGVFAFGLYAIIGVAAAYGMTIHNVGQTIIYIVLRKDKDDDNLLESFDREYEEAIMRDTARIKAETKRKKSDSKSTTEDNGTNEKSDQNG